jgi:hypothetical protein
MALIPIREAQRLAQPALTGVNRQLLQLAELERQKKESKRRTEQRNLAAGVKALKGMTAQQEKQRIADRTAFFNTAQAEFKNQLEQLKLRKAITDYMKQKKIGNYFDLTANEIEDIRLASTLIRDEEVSPDINLRGIFEAASKKTGIPIDIAKDVTPALLKDLTGRELALFKETQERRKGEAVKQKEVAPKPKPKVKTKEIFGKEQKSGKRPMTQSQAKRYLAELKRRGLTEDEVSQKALEIRIID